MEISDNLINLRAGYNNYIQAIDKVVEPSLPINRQKHLHKIIKRAMIKRNIKEFSLGLATFMGLIVFIGIMFLV